MEANLGFDDVIALKRVYRGIRWDFIATPPSIGDVFEAHGTPDASKGTGVVSCRRVIDALDAHRDHLWTDCVRGGPWLVRLRVDGDRDEGPRETYSQLAEVTGVVDATEGLAHAIDHWVTVAAQQYVDEPNGIPKFIAGFLRLRRAYLAGNRTDAEAWDSYLTVCEANRKRPWLDWSELCERLLLPGPDWESATSILSICSQIMIRYELGYTGYAYDRRGFARRAIDGDPLMQEAFRHLESTIDWHLQGILESGMPDLFKATSSDRATPSPAA